jgi:ketosteroid isomerase-like protein
MKKKMPIFLAMLIMAGFIFTSCKNTSTETAAKEESCQMVSPDSLIALWNNAWNTKNLEALKGMIADSAIAMDHEWYVQGKDSIFAKWITPSLPKISNIATTPLKVNSCCCCVGVTGLYTLDYATDKGEVAHSKGNFTFIWTKQEDKTYKLETMHMTEFHEKEKK